LAAEIIFGSAELARFDVPRSMSFAKDIFLSADVEHPKERLSCSLAERAT